MPRLRFFIEGDASGYTKAMEEAQRRQDRAAQRAEEISKTLEGLDRRRTEMTKQMLASVDKEEKAALERRLAMLQRAGDEMVRNQRKALSDLARAEKELTKVVDGEAKERARARAKETSDRMRAAESGAIGIARGTGVLPFLPFGGGGLVTGAGAAGLGAGLLARKAIQDQLDLAQAIREVQLASRSSFDETAQLVAVGERLGITTDTITAAMRVLNAQIAENPEYFKELGIELTNADGSARSAIAVFLDLRKVLAGSAGDANTLKVAQDLLGRGYQDLLPLLGLTEEQLAAVTAQADRASQIMGKDAFAATMQYKAALDELGYSVDAIVERLGQFLVPGLAEVAKMALMTADAVGKMISTPARFFGGENPLKDVPVLGGVTNLWKNWNTVLAGVNDEATNEIARFVMEQQKLREEVAKAQAGTAIGRGGGSLPTLDSLAGRRRAETDAIRDQIEALRELQQAERERVREAIDAIRQEVEAEDERHRKTVEAIDEARRLDLERIREIREREAEADRQDDERRREALRALEDRRDRELAAVRRTQEAERDAAEAAIAAVRARMRAADEAARKQDEAEARRRILGQDTVSQLQARIAELERLARLEDDEERRAEARKELADAEAELAKETAVEVVRFRSDTEEEYLDKVREQQEKVAAAERRVAEIRKAIARDAKREQLRVQVEAIQEEIRAEEQRTELARIDRENERRAAQEAAEAEIASIQQRFEASDRAHKKRLEQINAEVEAERRRIEEGQRAEDERRRKRDQAHEQEIRAINQAAESARRAEDERSRSFKQAADERIRKHEDELKAFEKNVDAQVKALEKLVRAITSIPDKRVNVNVHTSYTSSGTPPVGGPTIDAGVVTPDWTTKPSIDSMPVDAQMDYIRWLRENYYRGGGGGGDMIQQAAGGSVLLREPHFLVSARTGRATVSAAEHGSEVVNFGGIGREDAGGGFSTTVIVQGGVDSRDRAFEIGQEQYRWYRLRGGRR